MSYLNFEELQLGQEVTTDEFWQRYRPEMAQALRSGDTPHGNHRATAVCAGKSPGAFSVVGGDVCQK